MSDMTRLEHVAVWRFEAENLQDGLYEIADWIERILAERGTLLSIRCQIMDDGTQELVVLLDDVG